MQNPKSRDVVKMLKKNGFTYVRSKGDHDIYKSRTGQTLAIPSGGNKEVNGALWAGLVKTFGLK